MTGAIVVDKPEGWTSHDVVNRVRRIARERKIGHLGTLDPIATGVLPLVAGRATRLAQFYTRSDKIYEGIVRFGYATDTYDRGGTPVSPVTQPVLDRDTLERHLAGFIGEIQQIPPPVSAKKVGGVPAYKLARREIAVKLEPVTITVYELTLLEIAGPDVRLRVRCSAGTYVRSIAHELGQAAGCGAHVHELRRVASGEFCIEQAWTIPALEEHIEEALIPAARLLPELPVISVDQITAAQIRQGRDFHASPFRAQKMAPRVKAVSAEGELLAIGESRLPNVYHPVVVL